MWCVGAGAGAVGWHEWQRLWHVQVAGLGERREGGGVLNESNLFLPFVSSTI